MKNFVQDGNNITVKLSKTVVAGDVVVTGKLIGVAVTSGVSGDMVEVARQGVYLLPIAKAVTVVAGDTAYITSAGAIVKTESGNEYVGVFVTDSPATSAECQVVLH